MQISLSDTNAPGREAKVHSPIDLAASGEFFAELRRTGKKVALCHGVFDMLHAGCIAQLEEAKTLADVLVVSVVAAEHVGRDVEQPLFPDDLRLRALTSLACVDYVTLSPTASVLDVIEQVRPDFYCKSRQAADPRAAGDDERSDSIAESTVAETACLKACGGQLYYVSDVPMAPVRQVSKHLEVLPPKVQSYAKYFGRNHGFDEVASAVERMQQLRVLVLGDVIIDEFAFCTIQGLTSKGSVISTRFRREEQHLGGSLAIARHIANFCGSVTLAGVVGNEPVVHSAILNNTNGRIRLDLLYDDRYPTITKRRYIARQGVRDDFVKLFAVNRLDENGPPASQRSVLRERIARTLGEYDLVVLSDFGHGLIDTELMNLVQNEAKFLALNCQTNSANHGYNLITKYERADSFCLDEQEIRLAYSSREADGHDLLERLHGHLGAKQSWLTLGSSGSLGRGEAREETHATPALTLHVKDTTGAGDAFFALASISAKLRLPLPIGSLLGNVAGAITANVLGNSTAVEQVALLKFAKNVLDTAELGSNDGDGSILPIEELPQNEKDTAPAQKASRKAAA